jgi:hypothetical protein
VGHKVVHPYGAGGYGPGEDVYWLLEGEYEPTQEDWVIRGILAATLLGAAITGAYLHWSEQRW